MQWKSCLFMMMPEAVVLGSALLLLVLGMVLHKRVVTALAVASVFVAGAVAVVLMLPGGLDHSGYEFVFGHLVQQSAYTNFARVILLFTGGVYLLLFACSKQELRYEFFVLVLFVIFGLVTLIEAGHLLSFYLSFEIQSLASCILVCFNRDSPRSSEAAVKYFVLAAFSSCIMLYGISLVYGYGAQLEFNQLAELLRHDVPLGVTLGIAFIFVGILFKLSAAPFHSWAPDVYQGAPTSVLALFFVVSKVAFVLLLVRIFMEWRHWLIHWQHVLMGVSAISVIVSVFGALQQSNLKRLLAYSTIGHMGYILAALSTFNVHAFGVATVYVILYAVLNVGLFSVLLRYGDDDCELSSLAGLSKSAPFLAFVFSTSILSIAGIPPLGGFFTKYFLFKSLVVEEFAGFAVFLSVMSVVSCYYYLRVVKVLYYEEPTGECDAVRPGFMGMSMAALGCVAVNFSLLLLLPRFQCVVGAVKRILGVYFVGR